MLLHVDQLGVGAPLLVLPSFSLTHAAMAAVFEPALSEVAGCRRLYVDLPGTGASPPVAATSDAVLESIGETIEHYLGTEPFLVAGWSYGGYLALALARRLPLQVKGLLLVCTVSKIRPEDRELTGTLASTEEAGWLTEVPPELHEHFRLAVGRQEREVARRIAATLALNGVGEDEYLARLREDGFALTDEDVPAHFDIPISVLAGRRDRVAGYLAGFILCQQHQDADFGVLAAAGHYLPLEEPDRLKAETLSWLRRCSAAW